MSWLIIAGVFALASLGALGWFFKVKSARFEDPTAEGRAGRLAWVAGGCALASTIIFVVALWQRALPGRPPSAPPPPAPAGIFGTLSIGDFIRFTYPRWSTLPVSRNTRLVLALQSPVDPRTLLSGTDVLPESFAVYSVGSSTPVKLDATLSRDRMTVVLRPRSLLGVPGRETRYEAVVGSALKTSTGKLVSSPPYRWEFTVGSQEDRSSPKLSSATPEQGAYSAKNTMLQLEFSEPIDPLSVLDNEAVTLEGSRGFSRFVSDDLTVVELKGFSACGENQCQTPMFCWPSDQQLTLKLSGLRDISGNALVSPITHAWRTTGEMDHTTPAIVRVAPRRNASGVNPDTPIRVTFSTVMSVASLRGALVLPTPWAEASLRRAGRVSEFTLFHPQFSREVVPVESAVLSSAESISQQCFLPCLGP